MSFVENGYPSFLKEFQNVLCSNTLPSLHLLSIVAGLLSWKADVLIKPKGKTSIGFQNCKGYNFHNLSSINLFIVHFKFKNHGSKVRLLHSSHFYIPLELGPCPLGQSPPPWVGGPWRRSSDLRIFVFQTSVSWKRGPSSHSPVLHGGRPFPRSSPPVDRKT